MSVSKLIFAVVLAASTNRAPAAERYIIPVWGQNVRGANATYTGVIATTNRGDTTATVAVRKIMPILWHDCAFPCPVDQWTVPPHITRVISDQGGAIFLGGRMMDLGAVEIESDAPVDVVAEVFSGSWNNASGWQSVEVARDWITGSSMIARAIPDSGTFRLYLINPNDFPLRFEYRSDYGGHGSAVVPAERTLAIDLDSSFLCPPGCGGAERPTGFGFPIYVDADFPYLAAANSRSHSLSPDVRIARPLTSSQ
jgi:hypothetical protein